ncbi:MAG TPA: SecC motif-containing protein [Deltaproteobacteria bacterium]|nr:SecC motif-containing protein [Deltaproteobacteria bacterium]
MNHQLVDVRHELDAVRARVEALAAHRGARVTEFCRKVREVVIIASSSRGGSSVFSETLRASPDLLHLEAELNPILTLAGLHPLDIGGQDDHIPLGTPFKQDVLDRELALDAGYRPEGPVDLAQWATDLTWRWTIQWPQHTWQHATVRSWLEAAWHTVCGPRFSTESLPSLALERVHLEVIRQARAQHEAVHPRMWDLDAGAVNQALPGLPSPAAPSGVVVEEPPFVPVGPWARATESDLTKPFVVKTPSNAYRLPFLRSVFPTARFRVLHLTRNPAAAINGLVDGWNYHGFHSHPVTPALSIPGYAENRAGDARFWKYDLFPGWRAVANQPLVHVAAHQWVAAHSATLRFIDGHADTLRVRFEDVVGRPDVRRATFHRIAKWLNIPIHPRFDRVIDEPLPPVMATARPRARRWFARADALAPALKLPQVQRMASRLEYHDPSTWV